MAKASQEPSFGTILVAARTAAGVSRSEIAKECDVEPRTVARWEADENDPSTDAKWLILHLLHESGRAPRPLLEQLADASDIALWQLGIDPPPHAAPAAPPPAPVAPSPAARKAIDDAVREAAEDLGVDPRTLRPVLRRLLEAIAATGVGTEDAARLVVRRASGAAMEST
jgi:transcriptional regulator with XRE-family HTH domain